MWWVLVFAVAITVGLWGAFTAGLKIGELKAEARLAKESADNYEKKLDEALGALADEVKSANFRKELFGEEEPEEEGLRVSGTFPLYGDNITWEYIDGFYNKSIAGSSQNYKITYSPDRDYKNDD